MDEAKDKDQVRQLTRVMDEHRDDLELHRKTLREFRSQFFGSQDSDQSACYVMLRQDQLDHLENLSDKFKTTLNSLRQCLDNIEDTKLIVTGVPEYLQEEEEDQDPWGFEEKLSESVAQWKTEARRRRQNGNYESLVERYCDKEPLVDQEEEEEKERKTLSVIWFLGIDFGYEISSLLIEYFASLVPSKTKEEIERRTELVKTTIQSLSLAAPAPADDNDNSNNTESVVVERFIRVMESIEREILIKINRRKRKRTSGNNNNNNNNAVEKRSENDVLGTIFDSVINLEVAFSYPFFRNKMEKESLLSLLKKIRGTLASKLKELSLAIRALKKELFNNREKEEEEEEDPELKKVKALLDWESQEIWNGLDLKTI